MSWKFDELMMEDGSNFFLSIDLIVHRNNDRWMNNQKNWWIIWMKKNERMNRFMNE